MTNQTKLKSLLDKINWLYKSFEEHGFDNVSLLEKALLKEKILMFYDEVENLTTRIQKERPENIIQNTFETENLNKESVKPTPKEEKHIIEEIEPVQKIESINDSSKVEQNIPENHIPENIEPETVIETSSNIVEDKKVEDRIEQTLSSIQETTENRKEKFKKTEEFQRQIAMPKRDMREIIDLNKSFIFKAELFSQNNDSYNEFINSMNTTRTEEEAFSVMITWTDKLNWNTDENKAYDLLLRAIEKRFLPLI